VHASPEFYIALSYTRNRSNRLCYNTVVSLFEKRNEIIIRGMESLKKSINFLWPKNSYGYVYILDANKFHWVPGLGSYEVISLEPIKPIKILKIKNIPRLIKKLNIKLYFTESKNCILLDAKFSII